MLKTYQMTVRALKEMTLDLWLQGLREVRKLDLVSSRLSPPENSELIVEYILGYLGIR